MSASRASESRPHASSRRRTLARLALPWLGLFASAGAGAQTGAEASPAEAAPAPLPVHRPARGLSPHEALAALERGIGLVDRARDLAARAHENPTETQGFVELRRAVEAARDPLPRPRHSGRWLAGLFVCTEAALDLPELVLRAPEDLLVFTNPGPCVRPEDIALLERAATEDHLALCVIVARIGSRTLLRRHDPTPAQRALEGRTRPARIIAERTGAELARAHAEVQARLLFEGSPTLARLRREGRFEVALALVDAAGDRIEIVAPWRSDPLHALRAARRAADRTVGGRAEGSAQGSADGAPAPAPTRRD